MSRTLTLPLWLGVIVVILALWAALDRLLLPSMRWVLRRRVNQVLEEINTRLKIEIPAFKLTKRAVLIDRLLYDPEVQEAADAFARESDMPRSVVMERVAVYAREIVPSFNAYAYFRIGYSLARNVARLLYRVRLGYSDEEGLAKIPPKSTVVFLINHRSNMDYVSSSATSPRRRPRSLMRSGSGRVSGLSNSWSALWARTSCAATRGTPCTERSSSAG